MAPVQSKCEQVCFYVGYDRNENELLDEFNSDPRKTASNFEHEGVREVACRELGETDATKSQLLTDFRKWVEQHPSIGGECRTDDIFLLRFLRFRKFSLENAKESLESYIRLLDDLEFYCEVSDFDEEHSSVMQLMREGFITVLPERDEHGRRVIFCRAALMNPSKHTSTDIFKAYVMTCETLLEDEENQVRGVVHVVDYQNLGLSHCLIWNPSDLRRFLIFGEKSFPMRHKKMNILNLPFCANFIFGLLRRFMSDKLRKRMFTFSTSELPQHVPIEIMPKEYGGITPFTEVIENWLAELGAFQKTKIDSKMASSKLVGRDE